MTAPSATAWARFFRADFAWTCTACAVISKSEARFWLKLVRESMLTARKAMLQHLRLYPLPLIQPQAAIERSVELRDAFRRLSESEEQLASV